MNKAITILCLALCSINLSAQFEVNKFYEIHISEDSSTLNYRIVRGELITFEEEYIELKLPDGQIEKIPTKNIVDFTRFDKSFSEISNYVHNDDLPSGTTYQIRGSYIIIQLSLSRGIKPEKTAGASGVQTSYTIISGYQFNKGTTLGLGTSFNRHEDSFIPIFLDYRLNLFSSHFSIFTSANLGYALSFQQFKGSPIRGQKGGAMYQMGVGLSIPTNNRMNVIFELAYRNQYAKENYGSQFRLEQRRYKNFVFQIGVLF